MGRRKIKAAAKRYRVYVPGPDKFLFLTFTVRGEFGLVVTHNTPGPLRIEEFDGPLHLALVGASSCYPTVSVKKSELSRLEFMADKVFDVCGSMLLLNPLAIVTLADDPDVVLYEPKRNPKLSSAALEWLKNNQMWCVDEVRSAPMVRPEFTPPCNSYVN